jgi:hypothetical protein
MHEGREATSRHEHDFKGFARLAGSDPERAGSLSVEATKNPVPFMLLDRFAETDVSVH